MLRQLVAALVMMFLQRRDARAQADEPERCAACGERQRPIPELEGLTLEGLEHIARRGGYYTAADMLNGLGRELELISTLDTLEECRKELYARGCTLAARSVGRAISDVREVLERRADDDDDDDDESAEEPRRQQGASDRERDERPAVARHADHARSGGDEVDEDQQHGGEREPVARDVGRVVRAVDRSDERSAPGCGVES